MITRPCLSGDSVSRFLRFGPPGSHHTLSRATSHELRILVEWGGARNKGSGVLGVRCQDFVFMRPETEHLRSSFSSSPSMEAAMSAQFCTIQLAPASSR